MNAAGGIPGMLGQGAPASEGRDVFQGHSGSVNIRFPAVTAGQPVPPPFYTAVARICGSGGAVLTEARRRIFVPQVVKMVYTPEAVSTITNGAPINDGSGNWQIEPMNPGQWATQRMRIRDTAQAYYDKEGVNIRFINDGDQPVQLPFATVTMTTGTYPYGKAFDPSFLNLVVSGRAELYAGAFASALGSLVPAAMLEDEETEEPWALELLPLPIKPDDVGTFWGNTAAHECGHLLGLVAPGDALDGDSGWHNKPYPSKYVMDRGIQEITPGNLGFHINRFRRSTGREGSLEWLPLNARYLTFILPKEDAE